VGGGMNGWVVRGRWVECRLLACASLEAGSAR
jgi:hypothetical protein